MQLALTQFFLIVFCIVLVSQLLGLEAIAPKGLCWLGAAAKSNHMLSRYSSPSLPSFVFLFGRSIRSLIPVYGFSFLYRLRFSPAADCGKSHILLFTNAAAHPSQLAGIAAGEQPWHRPPCPASFAPLYRGHFRLQLGEWALALLRSFRRSASPAEALRLPPSRAHAARQSRSIVRTWEIVPAPSSAFGRSSPQPSQPPARSPLHCL